MKNLIAVLFVIAGACGAVRWMQAPTPSCAAGQVRQPSGRCAAEAGPWEQYAPLPQGFVADAPPDWVDVDTGRATLDPSLPEPPGTRAYRATDGHMHLVIPRHFQTTAVTQAVQQAQEETLAPIDTTSQRLAELESQVATTEREGRERALQEQLEAINARVPVRSSTEIEQPVRRDFYAEDRTVDMQAGAQPLVRYPNSMPDVTAIQVAPGRVWDYRTGQYHDATEQADGSLQIDR